MPAPNRTDTTLVMGDEDGAAGAAAVVYSGTKQAAGSPVDRAGSDQRHAARGRSTRRPRQSPRTRSSAADFTARAWPARSTSCRDRLGPVGCRPERRGARRRPHAQPDRGRALGPDATRTTSTSSRPRAATRPRLSPASPVTAAGCGGSGTTTSTRPELGGTLDPPARRHRGSVPQQAGQHGHRRPRQPPDPGGPGRQRPRGADRGLPDRGRRSRRGGRVRPGHVRRRVRPD